MTFSQVIRSKPILSAYAILTFCAILLSQIPLFNYLGYEFSAVIGLIGGVTAGFSTICLVRKELGFERGPNPETFKPAVWKVVGASLLTLVMPLIVISVNAVFVKNCSFFEGLAFFLLIPAVSVVYSGALGCFCTAMFRRPYLMYSVFTLLTLLHPVVLGYFSAMLFSYNVLYGYFPGLSYDEALSITVPLAVFRLATLVVAGVLFVVAVTVLEHAQPGSPAGRRIRSLRFLFHGAVRSGFLTVSLLLLSAFLLEMPKLRIKVSHALIQETLGSVLETRHFRIFYDRRSTDAARINWIAADHEFRLQQVTHALNVRAPEKIDSYIYPAAELKRELVGTGTSNVTKPWLREMHINAESVDQVLEHELVHVVAGDFGIPLAGLSVSPGLTEGLAMAVEWNWGNRTLHQYAAGMFAFGVVGDASEVGPILRFGGFIRKPSTTSYVLAGSFVRFLIDRYGIEKLKRAYAWADLESVYGRSSEELLREWRQFLTRFAVEHDFEPTVRYLFLRPSIFQKVCVRVLADINEKARAAFEGKNYDRAIDLYLHSNQLSRNPDATVGLVRCFYRKHSWVQLQEFAASVFEDTLLTPFVPAVHLYLGDAYWATGEYEGAVREYRQLARLDLSDNLSEAAELRLAIVANPGLRDSLRDVLTADRPDSVRVDSLEQLRAAYPQSSLVSYLLGRILFSQGNYQRSQEVLSVIPKPLASPFLSYLAEQTQALSLFKREEFQLAKVHFWNSLNFDSTRYHQNSVDDWILRCDWMAEFASSYLDSH